MLMVLTVHSSVLHHHIPKSAQQIRDSPKTKKPGSFDTGFIKFGDDILSH
jgi:hypothetical protein